MPSYYYPDTEKLKEGAQIKLEGEEFHHLARVTHRRTLEPIKLNTGKGTQAWADVVQIDQKSATLRVKEVIVFPKPDYPFAIAFALLKNRNDELIIEKCTELGATAFFPMMTEHSVRQVSGNTMQRFRNIALAAIKQCDNPWLPEIYMPQNLKEMLEEISEKGFTPIVCSERNPEHWLHHLSADTIGKPCFLIGAEGGWSNEEFGLLSVYQEISLGNLITRAETAAVSVSAHWQAYANQLRTIGTTK